MTTRDQARRSLRHPLQGERAAPILDSGPSLSERLAAAREAKGVDLHRAERDTKIRACHLEALERGDYTELPGEVYTKGFLRNYSAYLGLDPEEILAQWHRERGATNKRQDPVIVAPRPLTVPRQGIELSPGLFAVALLLLVVAAVVVFIGWRLVPFLQPPTIAVLHPAASVETVAATDTKYTFTGTASADATINIKADTHEIEPVRADGSGRWTFTYEHLHVGTNTFEFVATNPDTTKSSAPILVRINVPLNGQQGQTPTIVVQSPDEGAIFENGAIPIKGTATSATKVTISATAVAPSPTASPSPAASGKPAPTPAPTPVRSATPRASGSPAPSGTNQPQPATLSVGADGSFSGSYQLPPGKWQLALTAANDQGQQQTVYRTITVRYKGIQAVIEVKGGMAWIKVWRDGVIDNGTSGKIYHDGDKISITANQSVWIRTGVGKVTYVTVNGVGFGPLGKDTNPGSWRLSPSGPPQPSNDF